MVEANLEGLGAVRCSGVAISRTFVATARGCVAVPNALHDSYGDPAAAGASTSGNVYYADPVSDPSCEQGNAVEDGSFSTFFGETLPREAFNVYGVSEAANGPGHVVTEVIAPSSSRCAQSLALLRLESGLDAEPAPIGAMTGDTEDAVLSYVAVGSRYTLARRAVAVDVLASTTAEAPRGPRTFTTPETCPNQAGGAFFSSATGALLGLLAASSGSVDCRTPSSGLGIPLLPFQALLRDAVDPERLAVRDNCPQP